MADLFEFLIGTGLRKGEALGLHWDDVHLPERVLYVRCTLSAIDNNHLVITSPKTRTSKNWVAISPRVATALHHQARSRAHAHNDPSDPFSGLVFCRPDGRPLRPHTVLDRLRQLSKEAGVPRVTVHDLRHLAATITITAGVPLTVVSKTLRHSTLSTTANIYSHLTQQAAREAVDTIDHTLTQAQKRNDRRTWLERLRPAMLTDDVIAISDGAGLAEKLLRYDTPQRVAAIARGGFKPTPAKRRLAGGAPAVHYSLVNGAPAILFVLGDRVVGAVTFDLANDKIATVRGIAAPTRLVRLTEAWRQHGPDTPLITEW